MPTPGSIAHKEREARLLKKGKIKLEEPTPETEVEQPTQRQQPVSKNRAKKKKK
jgi:YidC/Oxa1 family membrane protein insertase